KTRELQQGRLGGALREESGDRAGREGEKAIVEVEALAVRGHETLGERSPLGGDGLGEGGDVQLARADAREVPIEQPQSWPNADVVRSRVEVQERPPRPRSHEPRSGLAQQR